MFVFVATGYVKVGMEMAKNFMAAKKYETLKGASTPERMHLNSTTLPFIDNSHIITKWAEQWEMLGTITPAHLENQYEESIRLFDRYRRKRENEYGYVTVENFDPNETHIDSLFQLKVPMLCGYAYQLIKREFHGEAQIKRLEALKGLLIEAEILNTKEYPGFSLLAFKSLNILVAYLMSHPDSKGDIWKFIIEDPVVYQYFKEITIDTISLTEYLKVVKKRANFLLNNLRDNDRTARAVTDIKNLTLLYYFVPCLSFEVFFYYPETIFPFNFLWQAHHHEVGISAIGDGNCSVHGSTINNTLNMLFHDLFHWSRWVNRTNLNEQQYHNINSELQLYLFSPITNPLTNSVDNFHDLATYFILLHENFYSDMEIDSFIRGAFSSEKLTQLFFGLNPNEPVSTVNQSQSENFKRLLGNARLINAIKILELSSKQFWLLKKLNWLLSEEIYPYAEVTVSDIRLIEISGLDNEKDEIAASFKYKKQPRLHASISDAIPDLNGKLVTFPIKGDLYNLNIRVESTEETANFDEIDRTILNYRYTRKNYADDYYGFLGLIYPENYPPLPYGAEADTILVGKGIDRLLVEYYERYKERYL